MNDKEKEMKCLIFGHKFDNVNNKCIIIVNHYYNSSCPHCTKVKPIIDKIEQEFNSDIIINRIELNSTNYEKGIIPPDVKYIPIVDIGQIRIGGSGDITLKKLRDIIDMELEEIG